MARQVAATASTPVAQVKAIDPDNDFSVCMISEIYEQSTEDVWILRDKGSAATFCPHGFQEELCTGNDYGGPRGDGATGNAVILGERKGNLGQELQFPFQSGERHPTDRVV